MADLWHTRRPPTPLDLDALLAEAGAAGAAEGAAEGAAANGCGAGGGSAARALGLGDAHAVWPLAQQARLFLAAVQAYHDERPGELGAAQVGRLAEGCGGCMPGMCPRRGLSLSEPQWGRWELHRQRSLHAHCERHECTCGPRCLVPHTPLWQFDKDDALAVEFVAAAANLRAACYGIPPQSLFATKARGGGGDDDGVAAVLCPACSSTRARPVRAPARSCWVPAQRGCSPAPWLAARSTAGQAWPAASPAPPPLPPCIALNTAHLLPGSLRPCRAWRAASPTTPPACFSLTLRHPPTCPDCSHPALLAGHGGQHHPRHRSTARQHSSHPAFDVRCQTLQGMPTPSHPWLPSAPPTREQGMAGNIIHAIATTNAIVSGLIVIEALKLLAGAPAACQTSFLTQQARRRWEGAWAAWGRAPAPRIRLWLLHARSKGPCGSPALPSCEHTPAAPASQPRPSLPSALRPHPPTAGAGRPAADQPHARARAQPRLHGLRHRAGAAPLLGPLGGERLPAAAQWL